MTNHRPAACLLLLVAPCLLACASAPPPIEPGVLTLTLPGGVPLRLVRIPAGEFVMGSPTDEQDRFHDEVQQRVTISRDFYLGETELTQAQWLAVMGSMPPGECAPCAIADDQPATCMDWTETAGPDGFLARATHHLEATGQITGTALRLPTSAEWEYAARAGTTTRFSFGDAADCADGCDPCPEAEAHMTWCGNDRGCARPVATREPNALGLHDMHGNVWEWVADRFGRRSSEPAIDPQGPERGTHYVIRGCSWVNTLAACRSAARNADAVTHRGDVLGFRVAMTVGGG